MLLPFTIFVPRVVGITLGLPSVSNRELFDCMFDSG